MPRGFATPILGTLCLLACGGDDRREPDPVAPTGCEDPLARELPDGTCLRPGVAPGQCADGFVHDGEYGCAPVLPEQPCPPGQMAVPGETACRPVMPCGAGTWGDLPLDATTEHVDQSYVGASDGSAAQPWTTIGEAVAVAAPMALVAVAAGTYQESIAISTPVRLWGVCPEHVAIVATAPAPGCPPATICLVQGADGSEIGGAAVSGTGTGVVLSGSENVRLDRLWIHDVGQRGIGMEDTLGPTSVEVLDSLIDASHEVGISTAGASLLMERSVVRNTLPRSSDQTGGNGLVLNVPCVPGQAGVTCDPTRPSTGVVRHSVFSGNHHVGIRVAASELVLESSVVRGTLAQASDKAFGRGINVSPSCLNASDGGGVECDLSRRGSALLRDTVVSDSREAGVVLSASDLVMDRSTVRMTRPQESDLIRGRGLELGIACPQDSSGLPCDTVNGSTGVVTASVIEDSHDIGLSIIGSMATVEGTVVQRTLPRVSDGALGRGAAFSMRCFGIGCDPTTPSRVELRGSLIGSSHEVGVVLSGSEMSSSDIWVGATLPRQSDGAFGDGVVVHRSVASLHNATITDSARAGLAAFGGDVTISSTRIRCAEFPLTGEADESRPFEVVDDGDNFCGCPTADATCKLVSAGLEPPEPIE